MTTILRTIVTVLLRRIVFPKLLKDGPRARDIARDDYRFGTLLSLSAGVVLPADSDCVCLACLGHRVHEMHSKWEQGLHYTATTGPPRRDMKHWRP